MQGQPGDVTVSDPSSDPAEAAAPQFDIVVKTAAVGLNTDWLPASEIMGEGIFLRLDEATVASWEDRPAVRDGQLD